MPTASIAGAVQLWEEWALVVTWQLAALAALAWVCEKGFRLRHPRVRHALWWFVLVAPLLLAPGRMALSRSAVAVEVPVSPAIARVVTPAAVPAPPPVPALQTAMPAVTTAAASHPVPWSEIAAILWMAGFLLVGSRLLVGHWRMRRIALGSQAATTGTVSAVLAALCEEAGLEAIPLRTSDEVTGPVLYGLRPAVLLPEGWLDLLSADDLRALLAHEVAHAKRRDLLANLLQRLVEAPLFFHPGAWLASRRVTAAREEMCDAWALSRGLEAGAYAKALASAADRAQRPLPVAVLGLTEAKSTLLRRVEAIMRGGSLRRLSRPLVVVLVTVALALAAAFAAVAVRANSAAPEEEEVPLVAAPSAGLTAADVEAALEAAGIRMQRFDYEASFPHRIVFTLVKYVGGKVVDTWSQGGLFSRDVGKQSFVLTMRRQGRETISDAGVQDTRTMSFSLSNKEGSFGGAPVYTFKGYEGEAYGPMQARLALDQKVPIYHVVSNLAKRGGIGGSSNVDTVADLAAHYDMAIIVYAELKRETQTSTDATAAVSSAGAEPRAAGSAAKAPPSEIVYDVINLKYLDAVYIAWLFGKADLPTESFWYTYDRATNQALGGGTTSDGKGGSLASLLPEGIYQLKPLEANSQQLVVEGTSNAIARLRGIIALIDRKPKQVILEVAYFPGLPVGADESQIRAVLADERGARTVPLAPDSQPPAGVDVNHFRVSTMNLMPGANTLPPRDGLPQALFVATPRINGDGTITLIVEVTALRGVAPGPGEGEVKTTTNVSTTTVNVRDGEQFAYPVSFGDPLATLVIRPRILNEQGDGAR